MTLDDAIDELYGADLDAFTAERTRLVRELRGEGRRDEAAELAKVRKPSVAAWALNQLARRNRRDVDLLLDAGHRLREAQAGVLRGADREAFERARTAERDALRRLAREADRLLREERGGASAATLAQVDRMLRSAAVGEDGRELLARGRFVGPLEPEGFGAVEGLAPATPPARRPRGPSKEDARAERERLRALEQAAKAAEARAEELRREWEQARGEAEAARAAADHAKRQSDERPRS